MHDIVSNQKSAGDGYCEGITGQGRGARTRALHADVQMRLTRLPGIANGTQQVAYSYRVARANDNASTLKMGEQDDEVRATQQDMIALDNVEIHRRYLHVRSVIAAGMDNTVARRKDRLAINGVSRRISREQATAGAQTEAIDLDDVEAEGLSAIRAKSFDVRIQSHHVSVDQFT